jgi:hypothetical protein
MSVQFLLRNVGIKFTFTDREIGPENALMDGLLVVE